MRNFLFLVLSMISLGTMASVETEEALILNQELQFLEDSVNQVQAISLNSSASVSRTRALNEPVLNKPSLEETYFEDKIEEDSVSTRSAVPKRRGF